MKQAYIDSTIGTITIVSGKLKKLQEQIYVGIESLNMSIEELNVMADEIINEKSKKIAVDLQTTDGVIYTVFENALADYNENLYIICKLIDDYIVWFEELCKELMDLLELNVDQTELTNKTYDFSVNIVVINDEIRNHLRMIKDFISKINTLDYAQRKSGIETNYNYMIKCHNKIIEFVKSEEIENGLMNPFKNMERNIKDKITKNRIAYREWKHNGKLIDMQEKENGE